VRVSPELGLAPDKPVIVIVKASHVMIGAADEYRTVSALVRPQLGDRTASSGYTSGVTRPVQPDDKSTAITRGISRVTGFVGSFPAILVAFLAVAVWLIGSFFVGGGLFNDKYQLALNTVSSIVTFVMVFVIQNSQNRDSLAMQAKLDAQNRVLHLIAERLEIEDGTEVLTQVVGLEDAPEKTIRADQQRVRQSAVRGIRDNEGRPTDDGER
jgi:low affinity Fe/Cu permease